MLNVNQALETILDHINILEVEEKPLIKTVGQVAAEDVQADMDVPGFDSSTKDGFAVRSVDISEASPKNPRVLRVIGIVKAGQNSKIRITPGTAMRIMTGAPLPPGADCVVRFEDTDEYERRQDHSKTLEIAIRREEKTGVNVKVAGEDIPRGTTLVSRGTSIGPGENGVLAALGYKKVKVFRRPVVAIIATGEELTHLGSFLRSSRIFNGNSYGLASQVVRSGGIPRILGIARDNKLSIITRLCQGVKADIVITTGGISMGDYDLVKDALAEIGKVIFWQIDMTPGKSVAFGMIQNKPHFALPGGPPANMISFEVLVRPAILKMMGKTQLNPSVFEAIAEEPIENRRSNRRFVWVSLEKRNGCFYASPTSLKVKGILNSIPLAEGIAVISEEVRRVERGDKLKIIPLDWR
jgi:molybdopterin molybdotransferase